MDKRFTEDDHLGCASPARPKAASPKLGAPVAGGAVRRGAGALWAGVRAFTRRSRGIGRLSPYGGRVFPDRYSPIIDAHTLAVCGHPGDGDGDADSDRTPNRHTETILPGQPSGANALLESGADVNTGAAQTASNNPNATILRFDRGGRLHQVPRYPRAPEGGFVRVKERDG